MGKKDQATKDAERNRKGEAASNRRLRWKTTGESDSVELQAEAMLAEQRKRPGHVDSGGVNDAEAMAEQDRQTGVKNTEAGKALEAVRKKQIEAVQGKSQTSADAVANGANAVMPSPPLQTPDNTPADTSVAPAPPAAPGAPAAPAVGAGGSPTPPAGQVSTPPITTPPVAPGGAGNGKPAGSDSEKKFAAIQKQIAINKFGSDLANYATTPAKDRPDADRLFEYGKTLGINEDQINAQITKSNPTNQPTSNKEPSASAQRIKQAGQAAKKEFDERFKDYLIPENLEALRALTEKNKSREKSRQAETAAAIERDDAANKFLAANAEKIKAIDVRKAEMEKNNPRLAEKPRVKSDKEILDGIKIGAGEDKGFLDSISSDVGAMGANIGGALSTSGRLLGTAAHSMVNQGVNAVGYGLIQGATGLENTLTSLPGETGDYLRKTFADQDRQDAVLDSFINKSTKDKNDPWNSFKKSDHERKLLNDPAYALKHKLQQENQKNLTANRDRTAGTVNMNSAPL